MSDLSEWTVKALGTDGSLGLVKGNVHLGLGPGPQSLSDLLRAANQQDLLVRSIEREQDWQREQIDRHAPLSGGATEAAHNAGVRRHSQRWGMS